METRRSYRPPPAATVSPSANLPAAAVVRKGRAREQQDLFAGVDDTHALRAVVIDGQHASGDESSRTGERNENSVLFSASVFNSPEPLPPARERMDSSTGTIDLCALAKANGSSLEYKPLSLSEPPMGAFVHDVPAAVMSSAMPKRIGLFVGAGAAAMLLLGIVGVATFAGTADEPTAPAHQAAARGGIVDSVRVTVTRDEAPAAPTAVAAVGRSGKAASGMGFASSGRSTSSSTASAPVTPKKPVVAKAADPCHCKGVLACVIRCSATGH